MLCKTNGATFKFQHVWGLGTHHRPQLDLLNTVLEDHGPNQSVPTKEQVIKGWKIRVFVCVRESDREKDKCTLLGSHRRNVGHSNNALLRSNKITKGTSCCNDNCCMTVAI